MGAMDDSIFLFTHSLVYVPVSEIRLDFSWFLRNGFSKDYEVPFSTEVDVRYFPPKDNLGRL
jgi:hypothetical protein